MRAFLIAVVAVAWFGCGPATSSSKGADPSELPANTEPVETPRDSEPAKAPLERAQATVEEFFAAFGKGDVEAMLARCAYPFYLDGDEHAAPEQLRAEFEDAAKKISGKGGIEIVAISAVSDWRAFARDYPGTETDLTAFSVLARVEGMGQEGMRLFVRMSDMKLVAIKD